MIKAYWYPADYNVGDTLTPHILKHFLNDEIVRTGERECGKLVAVGSIMSKIRSGDVVWGTGCSKGWRTIRGDGIKFLAVRGPYSRKLITGGKVPEVYGDPAILLPMIYNPGIERKWKVGIIPHYVDKAIVKNDVKNNDYHFIDVAWPWKKFVEEVKSCGRIISSSLHGIIIAEAYGIPAEWRVYSDKVIGKGFKFRDYLAGTGRKIQYPGEFPPIENIGIIQKRLIDALKNHYKK